MGDNNTPEEHDPRKPGVVLPIAGLVILLVGFLVAYINRNAYFGWFAYAPLSTQTFSGTGRALLSPGTQAGLATAVVGLLLLAFWAGYRLGRRNGASNAG